MVVRPATFVLLATLAAAAAGAGGWLAVRRNLADAAAGDGSAPAPAGRIHPQPAVLAAAAAAMPAEAPETAAPVPAAEPVAAIPPAPDPPATPAPDVPATPAAATERPAPAEATVAAEAPAMPVEAPDTAPPAPVAAVSETPPDSPATAPEPTLEANADRPAADAPPTIPGPDAAWRAAARDLPRVDGWVRSTKRAAPAGQDPLPVEEEELVISADAVIGLQVETTVSSADAEVEDDVSARVTRDVMAGDRVAIPAGTPVRGSVVLVEQAGKLRGQPRLGVRFHTAVMDDGAELRLATETVYREGPARGSESTRRIGGAAVGGAILGAIFGGRRGAAIGSAAGAAGGTALAVAHDGPPASFPAGVRVTIRLLNPATVRVDRLRPGSR